MDAERYVFLDLGRRGRARGGGARDPGFEALEDTAELELHVADLTPSEAASELRRPGVVGARPMPLTLIEPTEAADPAPSAGAGVTWGVQAVGADATTLHGRRGQGGRARHRDRPDHMPRSPG